jgi:predicted nuclease of predicted toxin-antitoxin system
MKFFIDAQMPYGLVLFIRKKGYEAYHTDDLPNKEETTDSEIRVFSKNNDLIVITKDSDFVESHLLKNDPSKLLWVSAGNIKNKQLFNLFEKNLDDIIDKFAYYNFLELTNTELIAHE